jgi:aspartate kinase
MARHFTMVDALVKGRERVRDLTSAFNVYRSELERLVQGVAILRELTPRTMDAFCSYGERLSSRIIAAGLQEAGMEAVWIDAKDFMLTDSNFGRAMPVMNAVVSNLVRIARPLLDRGAIPVTQGFIGVAATGEYTTMGRESSDFSASIIGAVMDAERVQIWTDVDGILTADPRMVPDVRKVRHMSFEEAFELSYFGAKVLHPNTMLPLLEKNIPVEIRNSLRPEGTGTLIGQPAPGDVDGPTVKSITYAEHVAVVTVSPRRRADQYLFWEEAFSVLSRCGVDARTVTTSGYSIACTIDGPFDNSSLKAGLEEFGHVAVLPGQARISIVGSGLGGCAGLSNRVFDALAGVRISMIGYGASGLNLTVVVELTGLRKALMHLHAQFFGSTAVGGPFDVPFN